jgi:hypothetical protein
MRSLTAFEMTAEKCHLDEHSKEISCSYDVKAYLQEKVEIRPA